MASSSSTGQKQTSPATTREEFVVRVPTLSDKKKYSVMKFSGNLGVDITQWNQISLGREDNAQVFTDTTVEPKFGAGSEFGKEAREEARKKKLGYRSRRYRIDDQPWMLTLPGKQERKFRGQREGGVTQNADYWIFVKAGDSVFDAYPVSEWYNFMPVSRYKTLGIDEAEEQFLQRNRVMNQFALKALLKSGNVDDDEDKKGGKAGDVGKKKKAGEDDDDAEDVGPTKPQPKGKGKKKPVKKKKKKAFNEDDDDPMASADSDDGDEEGREFDYMSSSESSSEGEDLDEKLKARGVDEEVGMRQLIASEDEEEEEAEKEGEEQKPDINKMESVATTGFEEGDDNESDSGSDSDDPDKEEIKSALFMPQKQKSDTGASSSGTGGPSSSESGVKRKIQGGADGTDQTSAKKHKADKESKSKSDKPMSMEEEVRRYLQNRPLSTRDLVSKFKRCCQGMSKEEIVQKLADILKRLKPQQERRNDVLYFSLPKNE